MGYRHTKEEILDGALGEVFEHGLSQLTFGRLAGRLGIPDRTIVYYFPTKDDLVSEVLVALGLRLQETLAPSFVTPALDHQALVRTAWPMLATPDADPVFALFFEAVGLAAVGREPYSALVPQLVAGWIAWASEFLQGRPAQRRVEAAAAIAVLDGLLLVRQLAGVEAADQAARRIGVAGPRRAR
jgi:AcrR family transcriptional regulator